MFTAKTIAFNSPFLKIVSNTGQIHYSPVLLYTYIYDLHYKVDSEQETTVSGRAPDNWCFSWHASRLCPATPVMSRE